VPNNYKLDKVLKQCLQLFHLVEDNNYLCPLVEHMLRNRPIDGHQDTIYSSHIMIYSWMFVCIYTPHHLLPEQFKQDYKFLNHAGLMLYKIQNLLLMTKCTFTCMNVIKKQINCVT
jgi:hypothetical protein